MNIELKTESIESSKCKVCLDRISTLLDYEGIKLISEPRIQNSGWYGRYVISMTASSSDIEKIVRILEKSV